MNIQPQATLRLPRISFRRAAFISALLCAAAAAAYAMTPRLVSIKNAPSLETEVPRQFGDWKEIPSPYVQVPLTAGLDTNMDQPYDQILTRTYVNSQGHRVMLALAWGEKQRQEVKIHRPDLCYIAQGFEIKKLETIRFNKIQPTENKSAIGKRMIAMSANGGEAVSYWMRIGNLYSEDAFQTRLHIFKAGLENQIPDGILVRASMTINKANVDLQTWETLETFLIDLVQSSSLNAKLLLLGQP